MNEQINLLDEISRLPKENQMIITTFSFDQLFFEKHIFPRFKNKSYPLLITDYHSYIQSIRQNNSRNAETRYFITAIKNIGSFHSKILLSSNENSLLIIMGSSNLTTKGYATNAEINGIIHINYRENFYPGIITSIKDFLNELMKNVTSKPHSEKIVEFIENLPVDISEQNTNIWFFHNYKYTILDQIFQKIPNNLEEVIIISPFFSQEKNFYKELFDRFDCPITIIIQNKNNNLPINIMKELGNNRIEFKAINPKDGKYLHAKLMIFKSKNESYCLFGSANITKPALMMIPKNGGNVETCILRKENNPDYFDYLLYNDEVSLSSIRVEDIVSENISIISGDSFDFNIEEAKITNGKLVIKFDKELSENHKLIININTLSEPILIDCDNNNIIVNLDEIQLNKLNKSSIISLELINDQGIKIFSDVKWIHNPQFFPDNFSILNTLSNYEEIKFLFNLLNKISKIPGLQYVIPLIDELNNTGYFDGDELSNREEKLKNVTRRIDKLVTRNELLDRIIYRFIERHVKRMDDAIHSQDSKNYKVVINAFNLLNQLIVWVVINHYKDIAFLRYVKINHEKLLKYFWTIDTKISKDIIDSTQIVSNVIIQIYIVDQLQKSSKEFDEKEQDYWVKIAFVNSFKNILNYIKNITNKKLDEFPIIESVETYEIITGKIISNDEIINCIKKIFPSNLFK